MKKSHSKIKAKQISEESLAENLSDRTSGQSEKPLPLHRKILRMPSVRYLSGFFGGLTSMLWLCLLALLLSAGYLASFSDHIFHRLKTGVESGLVFVFPDYLVEVGNVEFDFDPARSGWFRINDIIMTDTVAERYVNIKEFRMTPGLRGIFTGDFGFQYVGVQSVAIDYKADPPAEGDRLVWPINILDIPATILRENGKVEISKMELSLVNSKGAELLVVSDLSAQLEKTERGYVSRIAAWQTDKAGGALSFRINREGEDIFWQGNARNYLLERKSQAYVDFDMGMNFADVPPYDVTESTDNAERPYRFLAGGNGLLRAWNEQFEAEARYEFDDENSSLAIDDMRLAIGDQKYAGEVEIVLGDAIYVYGRDFTLSYPGQEIRGSQKHVELDNGSFVARIDLTEQRIDLGELAMKNASFYLLGKGRVAFKPELSSSIDFTISDVSLDQLKAIWPKDMAKTQFNWLNQRFAKSEIENISVAARYKDGFRFETKLAFGDTEFSPVHWLPMVKAENATFLITDKNLLGVMENAHTLKENAKIDFQNTRLWVGDIHSRPIRAELNSDISGSNRELVNALEAEPVALAKRMKIGADRFGGRYDAHMKVIFPLEKDAKLADTDINIDGSFHDLVIRNIAFGKDLKAASARVSLNERGSNISGAAILGALPMNIKYRQSFSADTRPDFQASGQATRQALASIGINLPKQVTGNFVQYDLNMRPQNGGMQIKAQVDAQNLGLSLGNLGRVKSAGSPGRIDFDARMSNGRIDVSRVDVNLGALKASGNAGFQNGKLQNLNFGEFSLGDIYQGALEARSMNDITIKNGHFDLRKLKGGGGSAGLDRAVRIRVRNVNARLTENITLRPVNGELNFSPGIKGRLSGRVGGGTPIDINLYTEGGLIKARAISNDAGGVLRNANIFPDMKGGKFDLKLSTTERRGVYSGQVLIKDSNVSTSRTAIQLLQAASIIGAFDPDKLYFTDIGGDVMLYPNQINLFSGRAYGPAIGLTLGGSYRTDIKSANLRGVITPAYLVNGVWQQIPGLGRLLGGNEGEGVFGVTYEINGRSPNYQIMANPLSLFTPGILREIWGTVPQSPQIPEQYRVN